MNLLAISLRRTCGGNAAPVTPAFQRPAYSEHSQSEMEMGRVRTAVWSLTRW